MIIVTDPIIEEWLSRIDAPKTVHLSLKQGFEKIFLDGLRALQQQNNIDAIKKLEQCKACFNAQEIDSFLCVDMDALMKIRNPQEPQKSVDFILPIMDIEEILPNALCIEGKLGTIYSKNPRNPTRKDLFAKFENSKKLLEANGVNVSNKLYLLVTSATLAQQKRRATQWNKGSHPCYIHVECYSTFLQSFKSILIKIPSVVNCEILEAIQRKNSH